MQEMSPEFVANTSSIHESPAPASTGTDKTATPSRWGRLWPNVSTPQGVQTALKDASIWLFVVSALTALVSIVAIVKGTPIHGIDGAALVDVALFIGLGLAVRRGSRWAAVVALVLYAIEALYMFVSHGAKSPIAFFVTLALINGVRGTFARHDQIASRCKASEGAPVTQGITERDLEARWWHRLVRVSAWCLAIVAGLMSGLIAYIIIAEDAKQLVVTATPEQFAAEQVLPTQNIVSLDDFFVGYGCQDPNGNISQESRGNYPDAGLAFCAVSASPDQLADALAARNYNVGDRSHGAYLDYAKTALGGNPVSCVWPATVCKKGYQPARYEVRSNFTAGHIIGVAMASLAGGAAAWLLAWAIYRWVVIYVAFGGVRQ